MANKRPLKLKNIIPNIINKAKVTIFVVRRIVTFFISLFLNKYNGIINFKLYKLLLINKIFDAYMP